MTLIPRILNEHKSIESARINSIVYESKLTVQTRT